MPLGPILALGRAPERHPLPHLFSSEQPALLANRALDQGSWVRFILGNGFETFRLLFLLLRASRF